MLKYERYSYNVLIIAVYYKNLQWRRCAQESGGRDLWEKKIICHGSMSLHLLAYWTLQLIQAYHQYGVGSRPTL
jgi:hypothetical protein